MIAEEDPTEYRVHVPDEDLEDLRRRLGTARFPERETTAAGARGRTRWSQGVPLADLRAVVQRWSGGYDWRRLEGEVNRHGSFRVTVDGLQVHFLHCRSPRTDARPLLLAHGWPGGVLEFLDVIEPLTDPADPEAPAFHVVVPSMPGFGFSKKPTEGGWGVERIADAWVQLMGRLGYDQFLAHGGDWGGVVATALAARHPAHVEAIHTTFPQAPPGLSTDGLTGAELAQVHDTERFHRTGAAYAMQQATRPQTIGYSLVDSPVGLLAWILDKFAEWTDTDDSPFETVPIDRVLDDVSLYWFTATGASAARLYAESYGRLDPHLVVEVPTAITVHPREIERYPRSWLAHRYRNIVSWSTPTTGGHFPALEQPRSFVQEIRSAFRQP